MLTDYQLVFLAWVLMLLSCRHEVIQSPDAPNVLVSDVHLILIDSQPNITTPIGITIDKYDQLYVLESHTHTPLKDYGGPKFDRIKIGGDLNKDLEPQSWKIFADSISDGMNIYWHGGHLYVVEKNKVWRFIDFNQDGKSDQKELLLSLFPPEDVYDHAGLLGITVSPDEFLYISRGNTGGNRWKLTGSDGSSIHGFGDGGGIVRTNLDGSNIEHVATGFWNPFALTFDPDGRLLATDNDPDSRGPNRLLEIVTNGDYGYQSLYGGTGVHPFQSWNGELPGTLPYAAPLGEAPTGLISGYGTNLPEELQDKILVQIWEENSIVAVDLRHEGESVYGKPKVIIQGDETFHPVAFARNSQGDIYFTDWVIRQYPNHGKGRLWKLSGPNNKGDWKNTKKINLVDRRILDPVDSLNSSDPFARHLARETLIPEVDSNEVLKLLSKDDAVLRIQGLLLARAVQYKIPLSRIEHLLADPSVSVRRMCLQHLARQGRVDALPILDRLLAKDLITGGLFESYIAALRQLQPNIQHSLKSASSRRDLHFESALAPNFLLNLVKDSQIPTALRTAALLNITDISFHIKELIGLVEQQEELLGPLLQRSRGIDNENLLNLVEGSLRNPSFNKTSRLEAIVAWSYLPGRNFEKMLPLVRNDDPDIAYAALWAMCDCEREDIIEKLRLSSNQNVLSTIWSHCFTKSQVSISYDQQPTKKPSVTRGKIIFELQQNLCTNCHRVNGTGGSFGPDLSNIGNSKSHEQIIQSILDPSREMAPEWQGWYLIDEEGKTHSGRQIDVGFQSAKLMLDDGKFVQYQNPRDYGPLDVSLMPDGLEQKLTPAAFDNMVTYLLSLKSEITK